jgi:hypothetical protein
VREAKRCHEIELVMEKKATHTTNRRDFSKRLVMAGGGLLLLGSTLGERRAAALRPPGSKRSPFVEGIEARLEGAVLHLDYRISSTSVDRRKLPPGRATFITAVHATSQKPLCFRPLAKVSGVKMTGPIAEKGGVSYHASVKMAALLERAKGMQLLVHASFWQYRSGVLFFQLPA